MSLYKFFAIVFVAAANALAFPAAEVQAQDAPSSTAAPAGMRDPGDPKAAVPAAVYSSAFKRYRPNADVEVGAWRDLNENVRRIGGWRVYGRELSPPASAADERRVDGKAEGGVPATAPDHGHKR